jgi:hypothetical protein
VGIGWSLKNVADKGLAECAYSWHDFMVQSRCTYILRCWRGKNPRCQGASYGTPKNQRDKNVRSILLLLLLLLFFFLFMANIISAGYKERITNKKKTHQGQPTTPS